MKKLIENWRDYEKSVLKEEVETEREEEYGFGDFINDIMTVSWDETRENPETGEMEEYVNYALNPAFLPVEQQEQLKESIPMQEGIQEVNLRQQYIDLLKAAPPEEALQEAEVPRETKSMRDYNLEYLKAKNPENADILDSMTDSDIERAAQKARFADPDFSEPSREETEIYATKNPAFAGPGQMNPFSGRVMSPEDIEARNNIDLGGGITPGDVQKEMALFGLTGARMTNGVKNIIARGSESGMGRKTAEYFATLGDNFGKPLKWTVDKLMAGGPFARELTKKILGRPNAKFTDDLAAWQTKDKSFVDAARRLSNPEAAAAHAASKPIHTPWFNSEFVKTGTRSVTAPFRAGKSAFDKTLGAIRDPEAAVAAFKNNVISIKNAGLKGLATGAGKAAWSFAKNPWAYLIGGTAAYQLDKAVEGGASATVDAANKVKNQSVSGVTDASTVPKIKGLPHTAHAGVDTPILPQGNNNNASSEEEPEELEEEKKKESMTRTEEIVREEVNKFLSNRRKK